MKAVQIVNPSEMKVVELEKPAVGVGEVLVRIKYVGFCGSDLNTFLGRNPMVKLPVIPGHEVGAVIEGWQLALQEMRVGDRWIIYIPYNFGYGNRASGPIPAFSTLIFEVELLGIA